MNKTKPFVKSIRQNNKLNYYEFYSLKNTCNICIYTQLAYFNCIALEMNPCIQKYLVYPFSNIENGIYRSDIPEFLVKYENGLNQIQRLVYSKLRDGIIEERFRNEELWCKEKSYEYCLLTELDIYQGKYFIQNLKYLYGLMKRIDSPVYDKYLLYLINYLQVKGSQKVKNIMLNETLPSFEMNKTIALGIYKGCLKISMGTELFSYDTEVNL